MTNGYAAAKGAFFGPDVHANRPSSATLGVGALFSCTTHGILERVMSDGTWQDWSPPPSSATIDPAVWQAKSEKGQPSGYASLDGSGVVPDAQIPAAVARDAEVTALLASYQTRSEEGQPNGYASLDQGGKVPAAQLPVTDLSGYQQISQKTQPNGYPSLDGTGKVPLAQLPPLGSTDNLHYLGDYAAGSYVEGDIAVYNGVAYMAVRPTSATPTAWPPTVATPPSGITVATSIAGLGTASDGKQGLLRIGTSAVEYQFVPVVYDATFGKWVGEQVPIWQLGSAAPLSLSTNNPVWTTFGNYEFARYDLFCAAGLTPQYRMAAVGSCTYGALGIRVAITLWHTGEGAQDFAQIGDALNAAPAAYAGTAGMNIPWSSIANPGSPKALLHHQLQWAPLNTGTNDTASLYPTFFMRWVST